MKKYLGPLHPLRTFHDTDLEFRRIRMLHSGPSGIFGRMTDHIYFDSGAICGFQATTVPDEKKGVQYAEQLLGTAFFVAPGVAVSAWHVFEDFLPEPVEGRFENAPMPVEMQVMSFFRDGEVLVWPMRCISVGSDGTKGSDVTAIGCHLAREQPSQRFHSYLEVSPRLPAIGEKLHILGLKEPDARGWQTGPILLEQYVSVGIVSDVYPHGRGRMPRGPCFAIHCGATGGMSGSTVFDNNGVVIGVLSTGTEDQAAGYSIVSSIAPLLDHRITQSWRDGGERSATIREILEADYMR